MSSRACIINPTSTSAAHRLLVASVTRRGVARSCSVTRVMGQLAAGKSSQFHMKVGLQAAFMLAPTPSRKAGVTRPGVINRSRSSSCHRCSSFCFQAVRAACERHIYSHAIERYLSIERRVTEGLYATYTIGVLEAKSERKLRENRLPDKLEQIAQGTGDTAR